MARQVTLTSTLPPLAGYMTVAEFAARMLTVDGKTGVSKTRVLSLIADGRVRAFRLGSSGAGGNPVIVLPESELTKWNAKHARRDGAKG